MNAIQKKPSEQVHAYHEHHMANGQANYFTFQDGHLSALPQQRGWLKIHARKAKRLLALTPQDRFVDLGCGEGYFTSLLSKDARQSLGIDFSLNALRIFKSQLAQESSDLSLVMASGSRLPLPDASVDKLFCNHVFEHLLDTEVVASEICRVLRPGGRVLIGVPLAFNFQTQLAIRLRRLLFPNARQLQLERVQPGRLVYELIGRQAHIRFYSLRTMYDLLTQNGFRVLRTEGIGLGSSGRTTSYLRSKCLPLYLGTALAYVFPNLGDGILVLAERMT